MVRKEMFSLLEADFRQVSKFMGQYGYGSVWLWVSMVMDRFVTPSDMRRRDGNDLLIHT